MNTNRSNNRRRGRGNNRGPGGGGQSNRIDNRARGNAPQMLEKYRKLAHDASLNDDRVQTEYYLQFADHYFRVIADGKAQKDEHRPRREGDRDDSAEDQDDEFERDSRGYDNRANDNRGHDNRANDDRESDDRARPHPRRSRERRPDDEPQVADEGSRGIEGVEIDSSDGDNPFIRDARPAKPRGRSRRKATEDTGAGEQALDPARLPPSIARNAEEGIEQPEPAGKSRVRSTEPKAPRPSKRRSSPPEEGDAEALKAAS